MGAILDLIEDREAERRVPCTGQSAREEYDELVSALREMLRTTVRKNECTVIEGVDAMIRARNVLAKHGGSI